MAKKYINAAVNTAFYLEKEDLKFARGSGCLKGYSF